MLRNLSRQKKEEGISITLLMRETWE